MKFRLNWVLIIDDDHASNFITRMILEESGYIRNIQIAESGMEALEYLKATKKHDDVLPDLILLDINMPGMDGWEFIEEYKKLGKELQSKIIVIMLTTSDNPDHQMLAKTHDLVAGFRTKPLTKDMLENIVNEYFKD